jgi:hypothetical protein
VNIEQVAEGLVAIERLKLQQKATEL